MKKQISLFLILCLTAMLMCGCGNGGSTAATDDTVVGTIEDENIYFWEYNFFLQNIKKEMLSQEGIDSSNITAAKAFWEQDINGSTAAEIAKSKAFDETVSFKSQVIYAKQNGATVTDAMRDEINSNVADTKEMVGDEYFSITLADMGITEEQYISIMLDSSLVQNFYSSLVETGIVSVTDEQIAAFYKENPSQFRESVTAKHILFSTVDDNRQPLSDAEQEAAEKLAYQVYDEIEAGTLDFDTAMHQYSSDPGLAENPNGYTFGRGEMVEIFETTAFDLEIGQMSMPVLSSFGYHIILTTDATVSSFDSVKDSIRSELQFNGCTEYIERQTSSYTIKSIQENLDKAEF